jgi:hypothetical protein
MDLEMKSVKEFGAVGDGVTDDTANIKTALSSGYNIFFPAGNFIIKSKLTIPANIMVSGQGITSILNFSNLGLNDIMSMGAASKLMNLKILGVSNATAGEWGVSHQKLWAGNDVIFEKLWIDGTLDGIETAGCDNVHIMDCKFTNIRNINGVATAIHIGAETENNIIVTVPAPTNVFVNRIYIDNVDRGVEIENGASKIYIENVYLKDCDGKPNSYNNYPGYSLNVHTHTNVGDVQDVVIRNAYLENCIGIECYNDTNYADVDMPKKILFENIHQKGMKTAMKIVGWDITLRNIHVSDVSNDINIMYDYPNGKNIVLDGFSVRNYTPTARTPFSFIGGTKNLVIKNGYIQAPPNTSSDSVIALQNTVQDAIIENIKIDGYKVSTRTDGFSAAIYTRNPTNGFNRNVTVKNCTIVMDPSNPGQMGVYLRGENMRILDSRINYAPGLYSFRIESNYGRMEGNLCTYSGKPICINSESNDINVINNFCSGIENHGTDTYLSNNKS